MILTAPHIFLENTFQSDVYIVFDESGFIQDVIKNPDYEVTDAQKLNDLLVPGFVNAHCHLELSHMKGFIPRHIPMAEFARILIGNRHVAIDQQESKIRNTIEQMIASGTVLVGDIANEEITLRIKQDYAERLKIHTFWELFGLNEEKSLQAFDKSLQIPERYKAVTLVPHAPFTVLPALMEKIVLWNKNHNTRMSIHALESQDEMNYFKDHSGHFPAFFESFSPDLRAPAKHPMDYLFRYFDKELKVLYVHMTEATAGDIQRIEEQTPDYYVCLCPRSNIYIHNKLPNLSIFDSQRLCLGTDSLASNDDLEMLKEILCLQEAYPHYNLEPLLQIATENGAKALSCESVFGRFKRGFRPGAVEITGFDSKSAKLHQYSTARRVI
jgi:cytosine/adenosine deaminase-related metal-dependent hydrolase